MTPSLVSNNSDWKKTAVPTRISRLMICQYESVQSIFLQEKSGRRELPLFISLVEAQAIERKLRRERSKRPFTHELFCEVVQMLEGRFLDAFIYNVLNGTYFARLWIARGKQVYSFESRPSDAIAVALSCNPPLDIYVEESLLKE